MLPPLACNGCRKCCLGDEILLGVGDDPQRFKTRRREDGAFVVRRKKNGNCVYLGSRGCTIQFGKPVMCQQYDCRTHAQLVSRMPPDMQASRVHLPEVQEGVARLRAAGIEVTFSARAA